MTRSSPRCRSATPARAAANRSGRSGCPESSWPASAIGEFIINIAATPEETLTPLRFGRNVPSLMPLRTQDYGGPLPFPLPLPLLPLPLPLPCPLPGDVVVV